MAMGSGLSLKTVLTRFLSHLLFEVQRTDLATSASVALILTLVALLAGYDPARRAASVDPTQALRSE
jgi:ABC-type lipoprotein release transport system permease subunit